MTVSADRLARTRLAILEHLQYARHGGPPVTHAEGHDPTHDKLAGSARLAGLRAAGRAYWREHPARTLVELAEPAVSDWARRHPLRFLGFAAAAGALLVLARPWRLISVTGLVVAALKSPQLSSLVMHALTSGGAGSQDSSSREEPAS